MSDCGLEGTLGNAAKTVLQGAIEDGDVLMY
jgi:hypothetical protein